MTDAADSLDVPTPLKVLSLSDLKDLPVGTVWDVMEQLAERGQEMHPTLSPGAGQAVLPGGAPDVSALFSAQGISSESESQNFFQPQKPARRKKHFPPPEPPEWALEGSLSADGSGALYSCIPARAIRDKGIRGQVLAVLGCVCLFTSRKGLAYPNQKTMGRILGISQPAVSRAMRKLRDAGYVRFLEPKGRRLPGAFQRGRRYQVLVRGNDPLPEKESVLKTR